MNKVAIITGATRGIGRQIALTLAKNGYNITIAGKSEKSTKELPGNIYSVSKEIQNIGSEAFPFKIDVRNDEEISNCVKETYHKWNRLDVLINNAGALWWRPVLDTPSKKYDLINQVNARASFLLAKESIPFMLKNDGGHIINCSPPLIRPTGEFHVLKGKVAYMISKFGMTLSAMGIAEEFKGQNIASNTLWPMTPVESYALINNNLGEKKHWRKADIISDSVLEILKEDKNRFTGYQLIDEIYLRTKGINDFRKYRCDKDHEPPKLDNIQDMWKS